MRLSTITNLTLLAISIFTITTLSYVTKSEVFQMLILGTILHANWAILFKYCTENGHYSDLAGVYGREAHEAWVGFAKSVVVTLGVITLFLIVMSLSFNPVSYGILINTPANYAISIHLNAFSLLYIGQMFTLVIPVLLFPLWASTIQDKPPKIIDFLFGFNRITDFIVHWVTLVVGTFVLYVGQIVFNLFFR